MAVISLTAVQLLSIIVIGSCQPNCEDSSLCDGSQLKVEFAGKEITCNAEVEESAAVSPPRVSWDGEGESMYVLVMADEDAPSCLNSGGKYWRHWVLYDIEGEDLKNGNLQNAKELTPYEKPTPPDKSGYHRYQLTLYLQAGTPKKLPEGRGGWDLGTFVAGLGERVAAFQFRTQHG